MFEEVVGGSTILIGGDAEGFVAAIGSAIQAAERGEKAITSKVANIVQSLAGVDISNIGKLAKQDKQALVDFGNEVARSLSPEQLYKFQLAAKGVNEVLANQLVATMTKLRGEAAQLQNVELFKGFEKNLAAASSLGEVEKRINALTTAMERLTGKEREAAEQALQLARSQEQASRTQADNDNYVAALAKRTNAIGKTFAQLQLEEVALLKQEAAMRGVSAQAAPYIAKIEAAAIATQKMGVSAGQTRQALAQLPAQFTDIFTSLAGGINPLLVLVQQGGQIKDSFGGVGNALKGIGAIISPVTLGIAALVGVVIAAGTAMFKGASDAQEFGKALTLTGNAAGVTLGQFDAFTKGIAETGNRSLGAVRSIGLELLKTGQIGPVAFSSVTKAAELYASATGKTAQESAADFAKMAQDPLKWAAETNKAFGSISLAQYQYIKSLQERGDTERAAVAVSEALTKQLEKVDGNLGTIDTLLKAGKNLWSDYWEAAKGFGKPKTVQDELAEVEKKLQAVRVAQSAAPGIGAADLNAFTGKPTLGGRSSEAALLAQRADILARQLRQGENATAESIRTAGNKASVELDTTQFEKARSLLEQMTRDVDEFKKKAATARLAITDPVELAKFDALTAKSKHFIEAMSAFGQQSAAIQANAIASAAAQMSQRLRGLQQEIDAANQRGLVSQRQFIEATAAVDIANIETQIEALRRLRSVEAGKPNNDPAVKAIDNQLAEKRIELINREEKARLDLIPVTLRETVAVVDLVQAFRQEELAQQKAADSPYGQQRAAFTATIQAQAVALNESGEMLAKEASLIGASDTERQAALEQLRIEITYRQKLRDLNTLTFNKPEGRQAAIDAVNENKVKEQAQATSKILLDQYTSTYNQISSGLADAILEGGKSGVDSLKNLFKSFVLKPVIQAVLQPVSAALTSAFLPSAAGAAAGSAGGSFAAGAAGSLFGAGGLSGSLLAGAGWLTGATTFTGSLSAAASLIGTGTLAGATAGAGMIVGALTPIALGIAALVSLSKAATPHTGGYVQTDAFGNFTDITSRQGGIQNADTQASVKALVGPLTAVLNQTAQAFSQGAGYGLRAVFEADGKDAAEALFQVMKDGVDTVVGFEQTKNSTLASDPSKAFTQFSDQAAQAVRVALLKLDLPTWAKEQLNALGDAVSASDLANGVKAINDAQAAIVKFTSSLKPMTGLMGELGALSSDAVYALAKMSGGIDVLSGNLSTYYQAFYSDAEQSANSLALIGATLKDVGLAVPDTRESFRALVEAQDLTSESGQKAFTALLSVSGAFDKLIGSAEQAQIALDRTVETVFAKFQTPAQQSQSKYEGIAGSIFGAGVGNNFESVLQAIIGASKDDIYAFAQAFLMIDSNSVAAKTAVVNAAGALFDLKDSAEKAAKAVHDTLMAAINSALSKFQSPAERQQTAYQNIATSLQSVGVGTGDPGFLGRLMGASKQQIYEFTEQFLRLSDVSDEVKTAVVNAAAGLADLKDSAATLAHDAAVGDIQAQLQAISDTYGDPSVINVVEKLSDAYMRNKAEAQSLQESLDQMLGTTVQTVQQALQTMLNDQKALQNFRSNLADTIDEASLRGQTPEQRVATLRARESNLFAQLQTASDPVAVAQKLQATVLARIKEEAAIKQAALDAGIAGSKTLAQLQKDQRDAQIKALEDQIGAAERLQKLSQDIAQFTGSLKFSDISPLNFQQQLEAARQLYMTTLAGAQAGDQNAQGNLVGNAKAYLDEARSYYASSGAYASIFSAVTASLDALGATGANLDPQLAALNDQLKQLQDLNNASTDLQQTVVDTSADEVAAYTAIDAAVAAREVTNQGKIDSQIQLAKDQIAAIKQTAEEQRQVLATQSLVIGQLNAEIDRLNNNFERFLNNDELKTAIPVPAGGRV